jgi:MYXO-CTERM domain-containing protein
LGVAVTLASGPSFAQVREPNGINVPAPPNPNGCQTVTCAAGLTCEDGRCERRLQSYFDSQMEMINELSSASTEPGVFLPLCDFQATLVLSESRERAGLAWYNATGTGIPATIHPIGPATFPLGQVVTSTDIRSDPAYVPGGLVGFVLMKQINNVSTRIYYSEYQRNANCTMCSTPGPWKMALAYRSTRYPNSYYLAFEDWEGADQYDWKGNDGDFNDQVFRIDGVTCSGGGEPCSTGMMGVCAQGVTECQVGAGIICKPYIGKSAEKCDNIDNDCNGMVDDGNGLCTAPFICSKGVCIRPCDDSEFRCATGLKCDTDGLCKDPRCADMDCPAGQVCQNGACVGGCAGFMCPTGQVCALGVCIDPCANVSCPGAVCEKGACVSVCGCQGCSPTKDCVTAGPLVGHCVDKGCATMTCPTGTVCVAGVCEDPCKDALCPGGTACRNGMCDPVPPAMPTGGGGSVGSGSGGGGGTIIILPPPGGTTGTGGPTGAGGVGGGITGAGGAGASGGTTGPRGRGGTCGCAVSDAPAASGVLFLIGMAIVAARRRRRP